MLRQDAMHRMFPRTIDRRPRTRSTDGSIDHPTITAAASSERNPNPPDCLLSHVVGRVRALDRTRRGRLGLGSWESAGGMNSLADEAKAGDHRRRVRGHGPREIVIHSSFLGA